MSKCLQKTKKAKGYKKEVDERTREDQFRTKRTLQMRFAVVLMYWQKTDTNYLLLTKM